MSSHLRLLMAASLFLVLTSPASRAAEREPLTAYQIELRLVEKRPNGQMAIMTNPHVMIVEGQAGTIQVGAEVPAPKGVEPMEPLHVGTTLTLRVFRRGDRVFLDANAESADVKRSDADSVRITSTGLRLVEAITLEKPIVVPVRPAKDGKPAARWELVVRRATPDMKRDKPSP